MTMTSTRARTRALGCRGTHLRALLGDHLETASDDLVVDHFATPDDLCRYYKATFGPVVATYAALAGDAERTAAVDRDFAAFAAETDGGEPGRAIYQYDYLLAVARRASTGRLTATRRGT
jgi:hypothetical protein